METRVVVQHSIVNLRYTRLSAYQINVQTFCSEHCCCSHKQPGADWGWGQMDVRSGVFSKLGYHEVTFKVNDTFW